MIRVALLPATIPPRRFDERQIDSDYAGNLGNAVFDAALMEWLPGAKVVRDGAVEQYASHDILIFPLSNVLSAEPMTEGLARLASRLRSACRINPSLRLCVASVGSQFFSFDQGEAVDPERLAFLRFIAERCSYVGTRGDYTSMLLRKSGIGNVWAVGDPALLHPGLAAEDPASDLPPAVGWTPCGRYRDSLRDLLLWGARHDALYVLQESRERLRIRASGDVESTESLRETLEYFLWPSRFDLAMIEKWLVRQGAWFGDLPRWLAAARRCSVSVGTRFHGNAVAILAGRRALQLCLDTRTMELCHFHGLPAIPLHRFRIDMTVEQVMRLAEREHFDRILPDLRRNFAGYLEANGVPTSVIAHSVRCGAVGLRPTSQPDETESSRSMEEAFQRCSIGRLLDAGWNTRDPAVQERVWWLSQGLRDPLSQAVAEDAAGVAWAISDRLVKSELRALMVKRGWLQGS